MAAFIPPFKPAFTIRTATFIPIQLMSVSVRKTVQYTVFGSASCFRIGLHTISPGKKDIVYIVEAFSQRSTLGVILTDRSQRDPTTLRGFDSFLNFRRIAAGQGNVCHVESWRQVFVGGRLRRFQWIRSIEDDGGKGPSKELSGICRWGQTAVAVPIIVNQYQGHPIAGIFPSNVAVQWRMIDMNLGDIWEL